jgi:hypothetical protein
MKQPTWSDEYILLCQHFDALASLWERGVDGPTWEQYRAHLLAWEAYLLADPQKTVH